LKPALRAAGWFVAALAVAYMSYELLFSDHGYLVYRQEQQQLQALEDEIAEMQQQREHLAKEILRLRNDPKALEELAHRELGYVYPDEYIVIIPEEKVGTAAEKSGTKDKP